ncbi:Pentatricopeptide repeat-containing protein [Platanthera zijinensis]|uniref:Pentatricopeptide repeat-containing protein n=1 Tax=Platanthera zijinensis TaxID=2320716 RepID=A0AAP0B5Z7_9ASPA
MPERNSVSWNLIKEAYFTSRSFEIALDLFKERVKAGWKQLLPSTLTLVLRICSVSTDLMKVLLFDRMPERNTVTWITMISGYGIRGLSRKTLEAFQEMKESGVSPDGVSFIAVLSACSHGGLVDEGQKIFLWMKMNYYIIPQIKHYVCMVDLYGRASRLDEAFDFNLMKKFGFVADTSSAACDVDEEHKLPSSTLAFALIRVGDEKIIRIGKNFRVFGDSHELFKFVSSAYEREIALKDPNQYHRFTLGSCSCHDFW